MKKALFFLIFIAIFESCSQKNVDPSINRSKEVNNTDVSGFLKNNFGFERRYYANDGYGDIEFKEKFYQGAVHLLKNPDPSKPYRPAYVLLHTFEDINFGKFDNDWVVVHQKIQAKHLEVSSQYWIPLEEQQEAYMMLEKYLFKQKNSPKVQAATAIYVEWLIKNEALEIGILRLGLDKLKGYWTKERLKIAEKQVKLITKYALSKDAWRELPKFKGKTPPEIFKMYVLEQKKYENLKN